MRLPRLSGLPLRVELRRSLGPHLAASCIPRRLILLDAEVLALRGDFERILMHEIFHFAWVRLPNATRLGWERLLAGELEHDIPGELGWSAEWRKSKLRGSDRRQRSPAWRRYACESFCDTAAWLFADVPTHEEFTLRHRACQARRTWFLREILASTQLSI